MTRTHIPQVKMEMLEPPKRELGYDEGLPFWIAPDFDTFVPDEVKGLADRP